MKPRTFVILLVSFASICLLIVAIAVLQEDFPRWSIVTNGMEYRILRNGVRVEEDTYDTWNDAMTAKLLLEWKEDAMRIYKKQTWRDVTNEPPQAPCPSPTPEPTPLLIIP